MEILYKEEHLICLNYEGGERPSVEVRDMEKGPAFEEHSRQCKIVFGLEGEIIFQRLEMPDLPLNKGELLLIPPDKWYGLRVNDKAKILILRLQQIDRLCDAYFVDNLMTRVKSPVESVEEPYRLKVNEFLEIYISSLVIPVEKGLKCKRFCENKIKELFYLLRAFYTKEELRLFFEEMLSLDSSFYYFVLQNYTKYKSSSEFATALNMSPQSFERRFKAVFNMPPYTWVTQQRAANIYHAICTEETPFKELATRFGFAHTSSFNDFCKKNLGNTPGEIQKNAHLRKLRNKMKKSGNE